MHRRSKSSPWRWKAGAAGLGVLSLSAALACSPPSEEQAERARAQTREQVQQATEQTEDAAHDLGQGMKRAGAEIQEGAQRVGREVGPYARDAAITARVKARLTADPEINSFQIDVDTIDGKVTLSGKVPTEHVRDEAEHLARTTEGVAEVTNRLEVGPREG